MIFYYITLTAKVLALAMSALILGNVTHLERFNVRKVRSNVLTEGTILVICCIIMIIL